jgi:hypothetical protein
MTPRKITKATAAQPKPLAAGLSSIDEYQQPGTYKYVTVGQKVKVTPRVGKKFTGTVTQITVKDGEPVEVEVVDPDRRVRTVLAQYVEGAGRKGQAK